jgi:hypothetical protein
VQHSARMHCTFHFVANPKDYLRKQSIPYKTTRNGVWQPITLPILLRNLLNVVDLININHENIYVA